MGDEMNLRTRLQRLEAAIPSVGPCQGAVTLILSDDDRDEMPDDAQRCPLCGDVHGMIIAEVVVDADAI